MGSWTEFLEKRAFAGSAGAAASLLRQASRAKVATDDLVARASRVVSSVATLVCVSPSADLRARALEVIAAKWDGAAPSFRGQVLGTWKAATFRQPRGHDVPPELAAFLRPRILPYLAATDDRLLADWLVGALASSTDLRTHQELAELLVGADLPVVLSALEDSFFGRIRPLSLWTYGWPASLAEVVVANPYLPLPLQDPSRLAKVDRVLLLILKGRLDGVADYLSRYGAQVASLLVGVAAPQVAPAAFVAACRHLLRSLPLGAARERLCVLALDGASHLEALSAVLEAGYRPAASDELLPFLFCTGQWEEYDRRDPDGALLRAWCGEHAALYEGLHDYRLHLENAAQRGNRPSPCPPLPPGRSTYTRRHRAVGSWPTDPGSGGDSFGGSF